MVRYIGWAYCYPTVTTFYIFSQEIYLLNFMRHAAQFDFFKHNAVCFVMLTCWFLQGVENILYKCHRENYWRSCVSELQITLQQNHNRWFPSYASQKLNMKIKKKLVSKNPDLLPCSFFVFGLLESHWRPNVQYSHRCTGGGVIMVQTAAQVCLGR
jgi:hypothetical protein